MDIITQYLQWCFLIDVYHATENYVTIIYIAKAMYLKEIIEMVAQGDKYKKKN